jgi:DNA ligase (NAD+)
MDKNTMWLSLNQITSLFGRDKSVISRHLSNIFREEELSRDSTVAFFATVQIEGGHKVERQIEYFNLDAILSVGYRVNSKQGTEFRKWATKVLQEHIIKGYTINQYAITEQKIKDLEQTINIMSRTLVTHSLVSDVGIEVIEIISNYAKTWSTLLEYDEDRIAIKTSEEKNLVDLNDEEVITKISELKRELSIKNETSDLFALPRGEVFLGIINSISQTFSGKALYKSNIERAAHLLYFIIKDHPFCDGNKRIGCFIFLMFLAKAKIGLLKITNAALTALALLIAGSDPKQKEIMIKLTIKMIEN